MRKNERNASKTSKKFFRKMFLDDLKHSLTVDSDELSLFDWYVRETEELIAGMLLAEYKYIQESVSVEDENINDSGIIAVEYYLRRIRYSHLIYMVSLLKRFLKDSCEKFTNILGQENLPFNFNELKGDQWETKIRFLERYGKFEIPKAVWFEIRTLISLRNNFVHDNGNAKKLKSNTKNILETQPSVHLNDYEIIIEPEYIYSAFESIKLLINFIEQRLAEIADRAIRPKIAN